MRSLVTILLGAVLLFPLSALATEIPGGPVYGHWYSSGNPYNINGNINVPVDSTLYIHEGVEVIFQGSYMLTVDGYLEALGTETDSIHFTASTDWNGIIFSNAPDSSHLEYCTLGAMTAFWGLIYCYYSNPVISHCSISNNTGGIAGGGITLESSSPDISYCTVSGNSGITGGGIYCGNGCAPLISHCNIIGNNAAGEGGGIGVSAGSNPVISNCTISDNWSNWGGGIVVRNGGSCAMTGCILSHNNAYAQGGKGGGIYFTSPGGVLTITNSTISNCFSNDDGGGIHLQSADSVSITGSIINDNTSAESGGAISSIDCIDLVIDHCDVVNNFSLYVGGILLDGNTNLTLTNSIFRSQESRDIEFSNYISASVLYNDFYGCDSGLPFGPNPPEGLGELVQVNANGDTCDVYYNIFLDPVLVGLYNRDYNLRWRSPCIDAGDPNSPLDPDNTVCDMGRFYFNQDVMGVVELYPHVTVIPPEGGQLVYDGWVFNFTGYPGRADIWTYAFVPGIGRYGPLDLYRNFRIPPDSIGMNDIRQNVPGLAPGGDYVFAAYVGVYPNTIIDSSYFYFRKSGSVGGGITGWFEGDEWLKVGDLAESNLPGAYALSQNYPNPFNAKTVISYQLPADSPVKLEVYNLLGEKVATLADERQQAGYRSVVWDASEISSGVYFYKLTAGDFTETRRMMLVK